MREIEINRIKSAAKIFNDFRCTIFIDEQQGADTVEELQEQKNSFLESIANEYGILGSHREIFLERYSPKNQCYQNHEIAKYIGKSEKDLQDALTAIHKLIENKEPDLKGKLLKKGRGRPAKGEEPWAKLSEFLWEKKFPNYYENINQETTEYQKLTVIFFRRMLEDKIKKLTTNSLLGDLYFDTESLYVPLGLVERKQKPHHGDIKPEHGSAFYRLNNDAITREFTYEEFLDEVVTNENSSKSQGRRLAIIGEPGSGKTTRLQQIARWLFEQNTDNRVIWVSLAELQGKTLEEYLLTDWLRNAHEHRKTTETQQDELVEEFKKGNIWLLLDGIDEIGSSGLSLFDKLPTWIESAKIIVTCRLNIWDGSPRALSGFDIYYNDDFNDEQQKQFAIKFLKNENDAQSLIEGLNQLGKERIKDLVKNPLRLTLICYWWQSHKGSLPDTKADLYGKFVEIYYDWKKVSETQISDSKKKEFEKALGRLAIQGLDRDKSHFRFTKKQINEVLGEADEGMFKLAIQLGWLNDVGLSEEKSEKIYTFFHPSFQEYFAALAIDKSEFLLNHIPNNPQKGIYRLFESKWFEIAVLWIGLPSIDNDQKNKLIKQLVSFDCQPKSAYIHQIRALIIATELISEFHDCEIVDTILDYAISYAFGDWNEETKELIEYPKSEEFRNKLENCSHPLLLKKLEDKLESLSENVPGYDYLYHLVKLIYLLEPNSINTTIAQKVVNHYPTWFFDDHNYTIDDYYQHYGFKNHQDFIEQIKRRYGDDYGTPLFWQRYEQNKDQNKNKPQKINIPKIPKNISFTQGSVNDDDLGFTFTEDHEETDSKNISELINDERWVNNNRNNQFVVELFKHEPSHLFSCAQLEYFFGQAIYGESSLMDIIKNNLTNFDLDENYLPHIEDAFSSVLYGMRDCIGWETTDSNERGRDLISQKLDYEYFCYKNPKNRLSMRGYQKTKQQLKFKELYNQVPENIFTITMTTTNLNMFLIALDFIIDLVDYDNSIYSRFMDKILSKFFSFDIDCYVPVKIADYIADRISYAEFYGQWLNNNRSSDQIYLNQQIINQTFSLSVKTDNLNSITDEAILLRRFKIRLIESIPTNIKSKIQTLINNKLPAQHVTIDDLIVQIEDIILFIKNEIQIEKLDLFLDNKNPSQLLLELCEQFNDLVNIEWNR
ncbi:NACHT domain-containing protein [Synechocystis sp. LEGE 06083]|uniref:NACHT domain-containing protein n=1 Tax=Synechocystis sp. LEGE 06083 TaxID=915336 RepID=UPI00187F700E|nr:NACHT domain-containing protein [Synechocystis sp. LEGE 06083]MBE9193824.1 NACHT domain-containing protein [Synechocystis sp. LEGE 06083]